MEKAKKHPKRKELLLVGDRGHRPHGEDKAFHVDVDGGLEAGVLPVGLVAKDDVAGHQGGVGGALYQQGAGLELGHGGALARVQHPLCCLHKVLDLHRVPVAQEGGGGLRF